MNTTQSDDFNSFNIHFEKEGNVARALVGAGFGWLTDNGNRFNTRHDFACEVFENAMCERDNEDANRVRRYLSAS